VHTRRTVSFGGERVALVDLSAALATAPGTAASASARAVVVRHEAQAVALEVDVVDGDAEVVVKPLGGPLAGARVVLGACVLGDGELTLLLSPSELLSRALGELPRVRLAAAKSPRAAGELRVLLAEDSAITRAMMSRLLRMFGYIVREAEDGERALRALEEGDCDLLITDIEMPNLDGIGLIERVRAEARWKRLPVVVLSTRGSPQDKERALRAGADAYLVKTEFNENALREVLARHLERT
jgi:two-component system chemotaxis sensor kinase CheA